MLLTLPLSLGCSAQYHNRVCDCVSYDYCVAAPLPHVDYTDCGCPTPQTEQFYALEAEPSEQAAVR